MAVTYEQAREIVRAALEPGWRYGTFCLDDREIGETDEFYIFKVGAREFLVDGDTSYSVVGGGVSVVYKEDGRLTSMPAVMLATNPAVRSRPNPRPTLRV